MSLDKDEFIRIVSAAYPLEERAVWPAVPAMPPLPQGFALGRMSALDLEAVAGIEARAYSHPWTRGNFENSVKAGHLGLTLRVGIRIEAGDEVEADAIGLALAAVEAVRREDGEADRGQLFNVAHRLDFQAGAIVQIEHHRQLGAGG